MLKKNNIQFSRMLWQDEREDSEFWLRRIQAVVSSEKATNGKNMYILSVEDDLAIREAIQDVLSYAGYEVKTAENGKEALQLLQKGISPGLILLDLMMPVMDGWHLIEELLKDRNLSNIPIVVVSAVASTESIHDRPNVKKVIKKPVVIEQLLKVVKDICGPPSATEERPGQ